MRSMVAQSLVWGVCFIASLMVHTSPSVAANCALYARAETGVALYGSAGGWWDEAGGRYERGHVPAAGAILVFKRSRQIPSGHVAVVARIISAHEILVDHANWRHGTVSRGMSVVDTSRDQDWTTVAVIDLPSGTYGHDYPTYGFVYPGPRPREIVETRAGGGFDADAVDESSRSSLLHFAAATRPVHLTSTAHGHNHPTASPKPRSPDHAPRAGTARPPTHPVRTAESKHHRA